MKAAPTSLADKFKVKRQEWKDGAPERARVREERRAAAAAAAETAEAERKERFAGMPHFVVRETREVTVKAESMNDAIALASAAFKHGQDEDDFTVEWSKRPWNIEGDTIDEIRTVNIKASEVDD